MTNAPVAVPDQINSVVDAISTGLDLAGVAKAIVMTFAHKRLEAIRDQLIVDAKRGKIGAIDLYDNPNVGGYIFRLTAAIRQGARTKNVRLLARYLFGEASTRKLDYDDCVEDATIIEGLTDSEIRCLAIYKAALDSGQLWLRPDSSEPPPNEDLMKYTIQDINLQGLFPTETAFRDASVTLQRWGLVRPSATWDVTGFEPTDKLADFMDRLELEGIIDIHR